MTFLAFLSNKVCLSSAFLPVPSAAPQVHQVIAGSMMSRWSEFVSQEVVALRQLCAYVARLREEGKGLELAARESLKEEALQSQYEIIEMGREIQAHGRQMLQRSQEVLAATFSKLVRHFITRRRLRILGACVQGWRALTTHKTQTRTVHLDELARARNLDLLAQTLRFWAAATAELRDLRRGIEQIKRRRCVRLAKRALHGWAQCSARRAAALHLLKGVRRRREEATKDAAFSGWARLSSTLRARRREAERQAAAGARSLRDGCFGEWRRVAHQLATARFTIEVALSDRAAVQLQEAFYAWASHAFDTTAWRMRQVAKGHALHENALLRRTFHAWRREASEGALTSRAARSLEQRHLRLFLRTAFDAWRGLAMRSRRVKAVLIARYRRIATSTLRFAWDSWRIFVAEARRARAFSDRAYAHFARGFLLRALHGWRDVTELHRRQRHVLRIVLQRKARWMLQGILRGWHEHAAAAQRSAKGAVQLRRRHLLRCAFAAWTAAVDDGQRLRRIGQKLVRGLEASRLARCFFTWRSWASRRRVALAVALRFLRRKALGLQASCFHDWRALVRSRQTTRASLAARRLARQRHALRQCLWAWLGITEDAHARRQAACQTLSCVASTWLLRRAFACWRAGVVASPALDAAALGFQRALACKRRGASLREAWTAWGMAVAERKLKVRLTGRAYGHLRRTLLQSSFAAWREGVAFASKRRHVRTPGAFEGVFFVFSLSLP